MFRNKTIQMKLVNEPKAQPASVSKKTLTASDAIYIVKDATKIILGAVVLAYAVKATVDTLQDITVTAANSKFNK